MSRSLTSALAAAVLIGCNQPPQGGAVQIAPDAPTTVDDLVVVIATGASDANAKDTVTYGYAWARDGEAMSGLDGDTVPASETRFDERWTVTVTPTDGRALGGVLQATVTIGNSPPTAEVALTPTNPLASDALTAFATGYDADAHDVEFTYRWTVDDVDAGIDGPDVPATRTRKGELWEVTVVPNDGVADGASATARVRVENSAPVVGSVALSPDEIYERTLVEAVVDASDPDGDEVALRFAWYVDGALVKDGVDPALSGAHFDKGQEVRVEVTPTDGMVDGDMAPSGAVVVLNTPPSLASARLDPDAFREADTVRCLPEGWHDDDGDSAAYTLQWLVDDVVSGTGDTLDGAAFDKGDAVRCRVTPTDGEDSGAPVDSPSVVVGNTPPVLSSAAIRPGAPKRGDTLTVEIISASDADGDEIGARVEWFVNGTSVSVAAALLPGTFAAGDVVHAVVTPEDGDDDGSPVQLTAVTVLNTPPEVTDLRLDPAEPRTSDALEAFVEATDGDGDDVAVALAWSVDDAPVGATGSTLAPSFTARGKKVTVTATPHDGTEAGAAVSRTVVIANTPPTAPEVSVPATVHHEDSLTCVIDAAATDADGDAVAYAFGWTVDGAPFDDAVTTTHAGDTVPASALEVGQIWVCTVTPRDDADEGAPATSESEVIDWAGPREFGTCGSSGRDGPGQSACNGAYTGTPLQGEVTVSGGIQSWTVPVTGIYVIEAWGAQGADTGRYAMQDGGHGAMVSGRLALAEGDVLKILVGQAGHNGNGTYTASDANAGAPSGGGGTFVVRSGAPLVVAGGGGGGGTIWNAAQNGSTARSGNQGNALGVAPSDCYSWSTGTGGAAGGKDGNGGCTNVGYGGGGFLTAGNATGGGASFASGGTGGVTSSYIGGFGGGGAGNWNNYGGGGGGYSGGGGGNNNNQSGGGGGGSFVASSATDVATSDGKYDGASTFNGDPVSDFGSYNAGHGLVVIDRPLD